MPGPREKALSHIALSTCASFCKRAMQNARLSFQSPNARARTTTVNLNFGVLEYHNQGERLYALRVQITEARESLAAIAREAKIDRRTLQRFVNQGVTLHESTIDKLEAAVSAFSEKVPRAHSKDHTARRLR
jgi:hypothetical protein